MWINDPLEVLEVEKLVQQYQDENPGVEIELIHQPFAGYHDKMTALALSGNSPDVMAVSRVFLPSYAESNFVQPIGHLLPQYGVNVATDVTEIDSGTYRGEIYGIPIWGGPYIMAYNVDMFEEAGIEPAASLYANGSWTWDTFIEIGKKLTVDIDGNGTIDRWTYHTPIIGEVDWAAKVGQFGGRVFNEDWTETLIESPEAVEALRLWSGLAWEHQVVPTPLLPEGQFPSGTLAIMGRWSAETINLSRQIGGAFRMDLVPQPAGPAGQFHIAGGVPITVSNTTPHLEEAVKFLVWYTMESDQWKLRGIPANMEHLRFDYRTLLAQHFPNADAVMQALSGPTQMEPGISVNYNQIVAAWTPGLEQLRYNRVPAETAAAMIAERVNAVLQQ